MKVSHIGYATKDINKSISTFETLGYKKVDEIYIDELRNVKIGLVKNDYTLIELVEPTSDTSPVTESLKKSRGATNPYHICYEVDDINESIKDLESKGFIITDPIKPAVALSNRNVVFLFNKNIGLIELVERSE